MIHRITLTAAEVTALRDRLVPICPAEYDLPTYSILRNLYGRLDHILLNELPRVEKGTK